MTGSHAPLEVGMPRTDHGAYDRVAQSFGFGAEVALNIFRHEGADVRVIVIDGEPWFVATDVARILGYRMASDFTRRLDDDEKGTHSARTPGGAQDVTIISESGLYVAVIGSQAEGARAFKRWVTHEVIPSIRRTGSYAVAPAAPALPQSYSEALRELLASVERNEALAAQAAIDAPKVEYVDTFVADEDLRLLRHVANNLGLGEHELRRALIEHRWIYDQIATRWSQTHGRVVEVHRYSAYAEKRDYFQHVPEHKAPRFRGEVMHTLKVTPAGAVAIARAARQWGLAVEVTP